MTAALDAEETLDELAKEIVGGLEEKQECRPVCNPVSCEELFNRWFNPGLLMPYAPKQSRAVDRRAEEERSDGYASQLYRFVTQ